MKKFRRIMSCAGMVCAAALGLLAPDAAVWSIDQHLSAQQWINANAEDTFVYEGTLENRVRALDAWQNISAGVQCTQSEVDMTAPTDIWGTLFDAGLLPVPPSQSTCTVHSLVLKPKGISAEYRYLDIVVAAESERLHVIMDEKTNQYLRIDFTCNPSALESWVATSAEGFLMNYKSDECMANYAALIGLGQLRDLGGIYTDGEIVQGYESDIEGTLFALSFKYATKQGLIAYKLFVRPYS